MKLIKNFQVYNHSMTSSCVFNSAQQDENKKDYDTWCLVYALSQDKRNRKRSSAMVTIKNTTRNGLIVKWDA